MPNTTTKTTNNSTKNYKQQLAKCFSFNQQQEQQPQQQQHKEKIAFLGGTTHRNYTNFNNTQIYVNSF